MEANDRAEQPDPAAGVWSWEVAHGSGWSREELDSLVAAGVPVVESQEWPGADEESVRWLEELEHPEHGPVSWLGERAPSGAVLADLEAWAGREAVTDYDALEVVALWHRMEAYCAAGKRRAAAVLARRDALAGAMAHLEGRDILVGEVSIAADELALRIGITKPAARRLVRSGRGMAGAGLLVGEALESGEIDAVKADAILDAIEDLGADAALEVQERLLAKAGYLTAGGVRRELAVACAAVEPEQFEERSERATATRRVNAPRVLPNGMASLYAVLPAVEATEVYRALDAAARSGKAGGDPRTLEQLRADALAAMAVAALQTGWIGPAPGDAQEEASVSSSTCGEHGGAGNGGGAGPLRCGPMRVGVIGGRTAHVRVVVPYTMLMDADPAVPTDPPDPPPSSEPGRGERAGLTGGAGAGPPGGARGGEPPGAARGGEPRRAAPPDGDGWARAEPPAAGGARNERSATGGLPLREDAWPELLGVARLDGYGPIPAAVARALAAGSTWARMVVDPVDRTVLELSRATYEPPQSMVDLVTAAQPRCVRPGCEVCADSSDIHHRIPWPVGATEVGNLDPGCRRDHVLVTHGGWHYEQDEADHSRTWTTSTGHRYCVTLDGEITLLPRPTRRDDPPPF